MSQHLNDLYNDVIDDTEEEVFDHTTLPEYHVEDPDSEDFEASIMNPFSLQQQEEFDEDGNQIARGNTPQQNDAIRDLLLAKGIKDPNAINYEDDNGNIEKVNFYDLPYEDQLGILQSSDRDVDYDLNNHEVDVVNFLRENNVSFDEAIEYYKRQAIEEYLKENDTTEFTVDTYSDQELFLLDLKTKYDTLTDDELQLELDKETNHPDLFKKKIDKIREEYKDLEVRAKESEEQAVVDQENEKFEELKGSLINVATSTQEIGGLDLDDAERNQILSYILQKDVNGNSSLIKDLDDPKTLFNIAWYAVKGPEAFDFVHDYYKKEIERTRKAAYDRGRQEAVSGMPSNPVNKVTDNSRNRTNVTRKGGTMKHMDDLYN
jgi:hypothetical protein